MNYNDFMKTIYTTDVFDDWFDNLRDKQGKANIQARLRRVEQGNLGDVRPVGEGVSELRFHFSPGYRIYLKEREIEIIVLLAGGDKDSQEKDIKTALELARQL
jgi:putative addiction module killer protein